MKKALMAASAAALALASLCIPPAQAHADDPASGSRIPLPTRLASTNPRELTPCADTPWAIARGRAPLTDKWAKFVGKALHQIENSSARTKDGVCAPAPRPSRQEAKPDFKV